jgi:hypothetical protein
MVNDESEYGLSAMRGNTARERPARFMKRKLDICNYDFGFCNRFYDLQFPVYNLYHLYL